MHGIRFELLLLSNERKHRMGELEPWMDENFIKGVFLSAAGETVQVKVIRDKNSG